MRDSSDIVRDPLADVGDATELGVILARGYLRLLARKVPSDADNRPEESSNSRLDSAPEQSVHGARLTGGER